MDNRDYDDIDGIDSQRVGFDFKGYLFKALHLWKLVLFCIGVALLVAYFINVRKENVYRLNSLITIDNDQSPFFTANTSISFNWGGVSEKVGSILTEIKTRTHNELVIDSMQYYVQYLKQGKYHLVDVYKGAPFAVSTDRSKAQILNKSIGIKLIDDKSLELFTEFVSPIALGQIYDTKIKRSINVDIGMFSKKFNFMFHSFH